MINARLQFHRRRQFCCRDELNQLIERSSVNSEPSMTMIRDFMPRATRDMRT